MDYFSQYTYAEVTANMISEIAYTETLTFWSTIISTPLAYFGALLATKAVGNLAAKADVDLTSKAWTNLMARRTSGMGLKMILNAARKEVNSASLILSFVKITSEGWTIYSKSFIVCFRSSKFLGLNTDQIEEFCRIFFK